MADPYKIEFVWEKKSSQIKAAQCNDTNVPSEHHWDGSISNQVFAQALHSEQQNACLTVNTSQSQVVRQGKGRFVYLDAGCWLNSRQTFGAVWGNQAVLCSYSASAAAPSIGTGSLLEEFLKLPGISKTSQLWIDGPNTNDYNLIHVILPDTHVAASPPAEYGRPADDPNRWNSLTMGSTLEDPRQWDRANNRDLFSSRASIPAMAQFLNMLASTTLAPKIRLTQVGDMYELWAGRRMSGSLISTNTGCLFTRKPGGPPGVALTAQDAAKTIGGWIADTHEFFPSLFKAYDACKNALKECRFIHGNHDSYLSVSDVITQANAEIDSRAAMKNGYIAPRPMAKTTVHPREATGNVFDRGIFVEHGQRVDAYNGDGIFDGWDKTQDAVKLAVGQWSYTPFDSVRRASFVTGAAALWLSRNQDFGCYIMGHTHAPELNYVEVTHRVVDVDAVINATPYRMQPKL